MYKQLAALFLFVMILTSVRGQEDSRKPLKQQLEERLAYLHTYRYSESEVDVERYSEQTAALLVRYLSQPQSGERQTGVIENLQLSAQSNDERQLRIYGFGYNCGGTRGRITYPVLQWRDSSGGLHAYNLSKDISCGFSKLHRLKTGAGNFYVLLGREQGNASSIQNIAFVLAIKNNRVAPHVNAFVNRPYINLVNTAMAFDEQSGVLVIGSADEGPDFHPGYLLDVRYGTAPQDPVATRKLLKMLTQDGPPRICLRFRNDHFERTNCKLMRTDADAENGQFDGQLDRVINAIGTGFKSLRGNVLGSKGGDTLFQSTASFKGSVASQIHVGRNEPAVFTCIIRNGTLEETESTIAAWRERLQRIPGAYSCDALNRGTKSVVEKGYVFTSYRNAHPYRIVLACRYTTNRKTAQGYLSVQKPPAARATKP